MTASSSPADVERFRTTIARHFGLFFDESKLGYLGEVLQRRMKDFKGSTMGYLDRLDNGESMTGESRILAQELTVPETYFFRHFDQFHAFVEIAVPDRLSVQAGTAKLSILSAGCASGEEAYSLAILLNERYSQRPPEVTIRAADINPASLEKARIGRYSAWALRETPPDLQHRWFHADGREFSLDPSIRSSVRFEEHNLIRDDDLWQPSTYDVVFCRNVLMYFAPEHAQAVVARITRSLVPGGYLFLGHAETLRDLTRNYHLRHTHGTFYYQRKDVLEPPQDEIGLTGPSRSSTNVPSANYGETAAWSETIQRSSERIQVLADSPLPGSENRVAVSRTTRPRPQLSVARELLRKERFSEALDLLRGLPPEVARDPDALLLQAVLLAHSGKLKDSEHICWELLAVDSLNAGAHYLLALCGEGMGDTQGAIDHDRVATYLDSSFAMPRLHLGLLARRAGDLKAACRELSRALLLLRRDDASRLLLFGGGFNREALVALCRAELVAAGGRG